MVGVLRSLWLSRRGSRIPDGEGSGRSIDGLITSKSKKSSGSSSERFDGVLEDSLLAKSGLRIFKGKNIAGVSVERRRN